MQIISIAGTTGKDAEFKTTQSGAEMCSTSVVVNGFANGEKTTTWYDVTSWGKGSEGLARILRKGSKVACSGELSTREHGGKTYLQVRTNGITIQGTPNTGTGGTDAAPRNTYGALDREIRGLDADVRDALDDDIPF